MKPLLNLMRRFIPWMVQAMGIQLQARVSPHVRAMGFGLSTFLVGLCLYRGWVSGETAGFLWAQIGSLFLLDIVKKAPDTPTTMSLQQVPTVLRVPDIEALNVEMGTKSILQNRVSINVPAHPDLLPLGEEFVKESK